MTTVYWNHHATNSAKWFELALLEPVSALAEIIKHREVSHSQHFTRCPAFKEYYKNTYVIKSPIDIDIMYDKTTDTLSIYPQLQSFFNENIIHRGATVGVNDNFLMSFNIGYLFIADKDCELELKSASMHESDFINKTNLISGAFNINKWYRPIEIAFEIKDPNGEIKIKRGDALAYIKFTPKDGNKVKVEQKNFPAETIEAVTACLYAKDASNKFPLKTLYKFSERIRNKLWFNKKKCPFNWRNK